MVADTRTWTDEQLRAAVAAETTWKGVAAALGLSQSSTPRLKRYAARLALDSSHFTGRRRWSDLDLKAALADSSSWFELLQRLDVTDTTETRLYVKGHAARMGLDLSRISGARRVSHPAWEQLRAPLNISTYLREAAESIAVAWLTLRGVPVAIPVEPMAYDLAAWFAGGPQRVQVKSSAYRRSDGTWSVGVGHRPYALDSTAETVPYTSDAFDYYFIVDGDGLVYLVPSAELAGRTSITIGSHTEYRVGTAASLLERS